MTQKLSNILEPTLLDNDFLQSFVRIGVDENVNSRHPSTTEEKQLKRRESAMATTTTAVVQETEPHRPKERSSIVRLNRPKSVQQVLQEERIQRTRRRRRRRSEAHRQEEVYTDKDRAAAVNMGSRDIKQSLKLKRKQDRSRALMIPEEAEPGAMLALGTREIKFGNFDIALSCINKALELSPNDKNSLIARSKCHLLLGQPQKALEDAENALRGKMKNVHLAKALYSKAEALFHLGDFELSLVYYYRGIKIRPKFDQFRLGVQKAKEAIQNIIGGISVNVVEKENVGSESCEDRERSRSTEHSSAPVLDSKNTETGSHKPESLSLQGRQSCTGKRFSNLESHLLGRLNVDKQYLQNFLKRPDPELARRKMPRIVPVSDLGEHAFGYVHTIIGPVIIAHKMKGAAMHELVKVGDSRLLGEVIRLEGETATIQVYEETSGLCYGDLVERTGRPLCVELAPGLLGSIFDGIQRPLKEIFDLTESVYLPRGIEIPAISRSTFWEFHPMKLKKGTYLSAGDIIGHVHENRLVKHHIMMPSYSQGKLIYLAPTGSYAVDELIMETEFEDKVTQHSMIQIWPVRRPRPVNEKIPPNRPLFTGQRVLDGLFPAPQGSNTAIPGAFGCGKTCIAQALTKYSNSDVVVYVGCGERGNEMSEVLRDFPRLTVEIDNVSEPIMKRTILVANTSNMPVAAREASVYTGITVGEYFRDQGYNVALMADSTSRWGEAVREISGRLEEMPAESGYPAYLSARLAQFYERGGRVKCLGNPAREGSLSIVGVVSPPAGDFAEPLACATLSVVHAYWALDKKLAQRKHFPSVDWLTSYTGGIATLDSYYAKNFPRFMELRSKALEIMQNEYETKQLMNLVGRESLSNKEKLILDIGRMFIEDFMQQDGFSTYDRFCPFYKTYGMLKNIITFYELSSQTLSRVGESWDVLRVKFKDIRYRLAIMKYLSPTEDGEELISNELQDIYKNMHLFFEDY